MAASDWEATDTTSDLFGFLFGALLERRYHLRVKEGGQTRTVRLFLLVIIILLIIFSSVFPYRRTAPARVESFRMTTFSNALAPPPPRWRLPAEVRGKACRPRKRKTQPEGAEWKKSWNISRTRYFRKVHPVILTACVAGRLEILPHEMFANNTSLRGCQIGPYTHTNSVKFRNFSRNGFTNFWKSEKV